MMGMGANTIDGSVTMDSSVLELPDEIMPLTGFNNSYSMATEDFSTKRRCSVDDCQNAARAGTGKCRVHGGTKYCVHPGCDKTSVGSKDTCIKHGGGRRCMHPGCNNGAVGPIGKCKKHGGGPRCTYV
jgi:hypothetical protein